MQCAPSQDATASGSAMTHAAVRRVITATSSHSRRPVDRRLKRAGPPSGRPRLPFDANAGYDGSTSVVVAVSPTATATIVVIVVAVTATAAIVVVVIVVVVAVPVAAAAAVAAAVAATAPHLVVHRLRVQMVHA